MWKVGRRLYASGTKKLTASYSERNDALAKLPSAIRYPLLTRRQKTVPVARVSEIQAQYSNIEHQETPQTIEYEVRGRVNGLRYAGKGLMFIDLQEGGTQIQVVFNSKKLRKPVDEAQAHLHSLIRRGDSISAVGKPWRTKAGELSILSTDTLTMLSPALHPLPDATVGHTLRKHNRVAELKAFEEARNVLKARSLIINSISDFLQQKEFLMVCTPHLSTQKGGASANTFDTRLEDGRPLHLRVAPELWLKRLIIGGFDRVFEIGCSYRNEGIDATHNPEFTTCEFYMAFADLEVLQSMTQDLLKYVGTKVASEFPQYKSNCLILMAPFKAVDLVSELERLTGKPLKLEFPYLESLCKEAKIPTEKTDDIPKILDRLTAHYIEPQCQAPTFITNHPNVMAPLAKDFVRDGLYLSKRFELFINGKEYVNAYEEENNPQSQLEKLEQQDPTLPDRAFVDALEWGLPPTGGWGLGIDRLVMLITGSDRINDVLAFGDLNQVRRL